MLVWAGTVLSLEQVGEAVAAGGHVVEVFSGGGRRGEAMLRALAGPFAHTGVKFVPLGGVGPGNLAEYMVLPGVAAVGGSWMTERSLIRAGRFGEIERLVRQAVAVARG